jgi:endonuclease YncB( thermonuclease family)
MHTRMSRTVAVVALLLLTIAAAEHPPRPGDEGVFYGPLVRVKDGDSLVAKVQGVAMDFRLADVDAPELDQPYGQQAKRELMALARGQQLVLMPIDTDRYGRTVVHVWNGTTYLNAEVVRRGSAWFYTEFARCPTLYDIEQQARKEKRGLWALPLKDRIEPWEWRARKRPRN